MIKLSARAVLPAWGTTPVPVLYRESGFPPAEVILEQQRLRISIRLKTLDKKHPLVERLETALTRGRGSRPSRIGGKVVRNTRLRYTDTLLSIYERLKLVYINYIPNLYTILATKFIRQKGLLIYLTLYNKV